MLDIGIMKEKISWIYKIIDNKFKQQFGFQIMDTTIDRLTSYMYQPKDSSSLAVTRILFGMAMLFDIPDERGGATMVRRWGDPATCHFPLIPIVRAVPMPYMALIYAFMWFGALGIMLGYKYRLSAITFTVCYWYLLLIDKSFWNNHSYLFGLVALLLACTEADCYWSVDVYLDRRKLKLTVPYWNYFVLKYQFFILYFIAGMKKGTAEWLTGFSVQNLSEHWVFTPFKFFLTTSQTDFFIVHYFIFIFDLTVAIWMMWSKSRHIAMVFCALFHLMNSRLFRIGMFPWVCLATMPLFYPFDWPKTLINFCKSYSSRFVQDLRKQFSIKAEHVCLCNENKTDGQSSVEKLLLAVHNDDADSDVVEDDNIQENSYSEIKEQSVIKQNCDGNNQIKNEDLTRRKITVYLIFFYVFSQLFLPYSHFITKGYNNWTNGLYGYSWDMMVHTWDTHSVVVKVVDNEKNLEFFMDPHLYAPNERWTRHGDMVHQYARCLKENLMRDAHRRNKYNPKISSNISIYVDVWCSLNERFAQRMFDPKIDILEATWSPLASVPFLMPLLDEADEWRSTLGEIKDEVKSWNNYSDVIFLADFPGYDQEKYIPFELHNVSLTLLEGKVLYEPEVNKNHIGQSFQLTSGDSIIVDSGHFHRVLNIGEKPAYYIYSFYNSSDINSNISALKPSPKLPIATELLRRFSNMFTFWELLIKSVFEILYDRSKCLV